MARSRNASRAVHVAFVHHLAGERLNHKTYDGRLHRKAVERAVVVGLAGEEEPAERALGRGREHQDRSLAGTPCNMKEIHGGGDVVRRWVCRGNSREGF